jgi:hypothetical protein
MADDDDKQGDGFDPWAELESASGPEAEGGFDFAFDDETRPQEADGPAPPDQPAESEAVMGFTDDAGDDVSAADDDVADWLTEAADEAAPAPLGVFAGDDEPTVSDPIDPEAVRVGVGESGIIDDDGDDASADVPESSDASTTEDTFGWDEIEVESAVEPAAFGVVGSEPDEYVGEGIGFEDAAASGDSDEDATDIAAAALTGAALGSATAVPIGAKPSKRPRSKKGGLGQMIGIVMGGLLALPITFAILIWGFRKDPLQVVRHVPKSMAFLFPQELVPGANRPATDGVAGGPTLDDVPAVASVDGDTATPGEPVAEPDAEPVASVDAAPHEPTSDPLMATTDTSAADVPTGEAGSETPAAEPTTVAAAEPADIPAPGIDPFGDLSPVMPVPAEPLATPEPQVVDSPAIPEPEPLDMSALASAVAAAEEAYGAVEASGLDADPDPARQARRRNRLLVEWYRQMSQVAEELSALERVAGDTGRPLEATPEAVTRLQAAVVGDQDRLDELARLSRDWLAYKGRSTSGIVIPAVLAGVRHVGPYWCSTVTVADGGDRTRDVAVISRSEPAAGPGDAVLVTGLIVDGDTLWASDMRSAVAEAAATIDPFAAPAP